MTLQEIECLREGIQSSLEELVNKIGPIAIGSPKQFPFGWRKAAKGRTVWRIVEEVITQNLEKDHMELGIQNVIPSSSEVSVYDMECCLDGKSCFINIKSAVAEGRKNKDDISKASGLHSFYIQDVERQFFVATFFIKFNTDMTISLEKVVVFPITWLKEKDIYVNPSNNGNLQAAYYKDLGHAVRRTNSEFMALFQEAIRVADEKKKKKHAGNI